MITSNILKYLILFQLFNANNGQLKFSFIPTFLTAYQSKLLVKKHKHYQLPE